MFDRFTDRAREALVLARQEADAQDGELLGAEFILLGVLDRGSGALRILRELRVDPGLLRGEVLALTEKSIFSPATRPCSGRSDWMRILELAMAEAGEGIDHYIGTEHLLAAILLDADNAAAKLLARSDVGLDDVRRELEKFSGPDDAGPEDRHGVHARG